MGEESGARLMGMGKKATTPSFVHEFPLRVSVYEAHQIEKRFEKGRQIYNAALSESLKRLKRVKHSPEMRALDLVPNAIKYDYGADGKRKWSKAYKEAYGAMEARYGFREYDLNAWAKGFTGTWVAEGLNGQVFRALVRRAFMTVKKYSLGKIGEPGFRGKREPLESIENSCNTQGLMWREGVLYWNANDLALRAVIERTPRNEYALRCRVKFPRLVRKNLNGKARYFVQLVLEGWPFPEYEKRTAMAGSVVGLDLGPSKVAVVSDSYAGLLDLLPELKARAKQIKRLGRKMDRQRRASNPDNYNADGTVKKKQARHRWKNTNGYKRARAQAAEAHRLLAEQRRTLHGAFTNWVMRQGETIKLEKLNYVAWQRNKRYGRRVGRNAPGMMVALLRRKAGERVVEVNAYRARLSQFCVCGRYVKKSLSTRWHKCECGASVQRDVMSAWGARYTEEDGTLNAAKAQADWPSAETRLRTALGGEVTGDTQGES